MLMNEVKVYSIFIPKLSTQVLIMLNGIHYNHLPKTHTQIIPSNLEDTYLITS
jgi:hypothetical protein